MVVIWVCSCDTTPCSEDSSDGELMPLAAWSAMVRICCSRLICCCTAPSAVCTSEIAWLALEVACVTPPIWVWKPWAAMKPAGLSAGLLMERPEDNCCSRELVLFEVLDNEFSANSAETLVWIDPANITLLLARWPYWRRCARWVQPQGRCGREVPPTPAESRLPWEDGRFAKLLREKRKNYDTLATKS